MLVRSECRESSLERCGSELLVSTGSLQPGPKHNLIGSLRMQPAEALCDLTTSEGTFRSCKRQTSPLRSFFPVYPATDRLLSNLAERRQHPRPRERTDFFTWTLDLFPEELCCPADACRFILLPIVKKNKKNKSQSGTPSHGSLHKSDRVSAAGGRSDPGAAAHVATDGV